MLRTAAEPDNHLITTTWAVKAHGFGDSSSVVSSGSGPGEEGGWLTQLFSLNGALMRKDRRTL